MLGLFAILIIIGAVKLFMNYRNIEKGRSIVTGASLVLNIIAVLFLTMARIPYATTVAFLLFIVKEIMLFKIPQNEH